MKYQTQILAVAIVGLFLLVAQQTAWSQVYDGLTKPPTGVWLLDQTGKIDQAAKTAINDVCQEVSEKFSGEIMVVVVETTNGENHRQYGTDLFNAWGIGSTFKNNGILVFAALADRKAEIILGDGEDLDHDVNHVEVIMDYFLLPNFKQGNYGGGLYEAARACAARVFGMSDLSSPVDLPASSNSETNNARTPNRKPPATPANLNPGNNNRFKRQPRGLNNLMPWLIGIGGLAGLGGIVFLFLKYQWRYRPRTCDECGEKMVMLSEQQDDEFLSAPEILEEKLGSVDYDVWACFRCEFVDKFRHGTFFTRYSKCPSCSFRTKSKITQTTIQATTLHGGRVRVRESCANCDYRNSYSYATPRITKSSTSSGGFGSSSSSSGGFSGGFGGGGRSGGTSSGRGASGSW